MTEEQGRAEVLRVARDFLGTPWRHMGRIKGKNGGVDCAQFVYCVYAEAKLIDPSKYPKVEWYPRDWFMHRDEDRLIEVVRRFAHEIEGPPKPGDVALWKFGRTHSHAAIIIDWPEIIHADVEAGEVLYARGDGGRLAARAPKFFTRW